MAVKFDSSRRRLLVRSGMVVGGGVVALGAGLPVAYHLHHQETGPAYAAWGQTDKGDLTDAEFIVQCGTLAASPHNTQPWKFAIDGDRLHVFADRERNLGPADPERRMMLQAVGCALENMEVAAAKLGYQLAVEALTANERFAQDGLCATVRLVRQSPQDHPWFPALFRRQTTRLPYHGDVPEINALLETLGGQAVYPGVRIAFAGSASEFMDIDRLNRRAVQHFVEDEAQLRGGMRWFRITRGTWETKGDGIAIYTSNAPWFVKSAIELFVTRADLMGPDFKQGEIDHVAALSPETPLWGLVYGEQADNNSRVLAGRVLERLYLQAMMHGASLHPMNYAAEIPTYADQLRDIFDLDPGAEPLLLFRTGLAAGTLGRSVRRPLASVLV